MRKPTRLEMKLGPIPGAEREAGDLADAPRGQRPDVDAAEASTAPAEAPPQATRALLATKVGERDDAAEKLTQALDERARAERAVEDAEAACSAARVRTVTRRGDPESVAALERARALVREAIEARTRAEDQAELAAEIAAHCEAEAEAAAAAVRTAEVERVRRALTARRPKRRADLVSLIIEEFLDWKIARGPGNWTSEWETMLVNRIGADLNPLALTQGADRLEAEMLANEGEPETGGDA